MGVGNSTVTEFIEAGKEKNLSHYNLQIKDYFVNQSDNVRLVIGNKNLLDKYYYDLVKHTYELVLTDKELEYYRYKPRLFCLDYYGTIELWGALLRFNNILTPAEFDKAKIKVFTLSFVDILQEILTIEGDTIDKNVDYVQR